MKGPNCDTVTLQEHDGDIHVQRRIPTQATQTNPDQLMAQLAKVDLLRRPFSTLQDLLNYRSARSALAEGADEFRVLFRRFLNSGVDCQCLWLDFDPPCDANLRPHWMSINLNGIEHNATQVGAVFLDLPDDHFDSVICMSLGRFSRPHGLVAEMRRVLKQSGQIWVETPLNAPYSDGSKGLEADYWRITPDGLRVMLERFDEIFCSAYSPNGSTLRSYSFFYGLKPSAEVSNLITGNPIDVGKQQC